MIDPWILFLKSTHGAADSISLARMTNMLYGRGVKAGAETRTKLGRAITLVMDAGGDVRRNSDFNSHMRPFAKKYAYLCTGTAWQARRAHRWQHGAISVGRCSIFPALNHCANSIAVAAIRRSAASAKRKWPKGRNGRVFPSNNPV